MKNTLNKKAFAISMTVIMLMIQILPVNVYAGWNGEEVLERGVDEAIAYAEGGNDSDWEYRANWNDSNTVCITGYNGSETDIVIPSELDGKRVTGIGDSAFRYCESLISVTIPEGVTSIGYYYGAFVECRALAEINVSVGNQNYASEEGVLYNKTKDVLIFCPAGKKGSVTISDGVTTIGDDAFDGCRSLTDIMMPEGVTRIGEEAFRNCSSLTSIELPGEVTSIGDCAFGGCRGLTDIRIPEGVTSIGSGAFGDCGGLTSIRIPEGVTSIERYAFGDCSSLTSIRIPRGVISIGDYAFRSCSRLNNIELPDGLKSIGEHAFKSCNSLTKIKLPDSIFSIGFNAFDKDIDFIYSSGTYAELYVQSIIDNDSEWSCVLLSDRTIQIAGKESEDLDEELVIPETISGLPVTSIKNNSFSGTDIASVVIPLNVEMIGDYAFYGCRNLQRIIFSENSKLKN